MKKLINFLKKRLSFHVMDIFGFIAAGILIFNTADTQLLFYRLADPAFYLSLLLVAFLSRSLFFLVILRGEVFYLKHSILCIFTDYLRLVLVTLSVVGTYLFIFAIL